MTSTLASPRIKKARTYAVYAALVLGGIGGCHAITDSIGSSPDITGTVLPAIHESTLVSAKAEDFVMTYLSLRSGEESRLQEFVTAKDLKLPTNPIPATDPIVIVAKPADSAGDFHLWRVVVSVNQNDVASGTYSRVYYQVPMGIVNERPRVLDMPAVIAPPAIGFDAPQNYETKLDPADLITKTAEGYLAAYTTGEGDIRSYQTADATDKAITPAPFKDVKITGVYTNGITGNTQPQEEEASASVKVTAIGYTKNYATVTVTYFLRFSFEGKRWLVHENDRVPQLRTDTAPGPATTTSSQSTSTTAPAPSAEAN
jgi:hypothetical protein